MKLKRYECQSRAVDACKSVRNLNNRSISGENKIYLLDFMFNPGRFFFVHLRVGATAAQIFAYNYPERVH